MLSVYNLTATAFITTSNICVPGNSQVSLNPHKDCIRNALLLYPFHEMGKLKHHLQVKHSDNWGRRNSSLLYESVWSSPAQRDDCMVWREKVWIRAWLPLICCAILGKFLNISGPQFLDLHDGLIKSQDFYIYIEKSRWKDVGNCKAPWKCSFIFIIRTSILLPCFLKREWMREKWKFATYIISPVLFLKYFLLMSLMVNQLQYPVKFTGIFLKD